jgi:hypothetical protein
MPAQPSPRRPGPVAVNAFYRLGYVSVDDDSLAGTGSSAGRFNSTVHLAGASASMAPGPLPFGWNISAGHVSTSSSGFDTEFESQFIRGDAILPVNPALALTAGIGYSRGKATQRDFLRGPNGAPLFDAAGNLLVDPNGPRVTAYDQDGLFADAGFIWRPSRRSELQLRAGINDDGDPIVAGSAPSRSAASSASASRCTTTMRRSGRHSPRISGTCRVSLRSSMTFSAAASLPAACSTSRRRGKGVCLSPALQSLTGASYRVRGGSMLFSGNGRLWSWGGGVTYARRDFYLPTAPFSMTLSPRTTRISRLFGSISRRLGRYADLGFDGFVSIFNTDAPTIDDVTSIGGRVNFSRSFPAQPDGVAGRDSDWSTGPSAWATTAWLRTASSDFVILFEVKARGQAE